MAPCTAGHPVTWGRRRRGPLPERPGVAAGFGLACAAALTAVLPLAPAAVGDTCDPLPGSENSCAGQPPLTWPVAQGNFTSPGDPGWVFFKPFFHPGGATGPKAEASRAEQYGCGIAPDGAVGCDHVPSWPGAGPGCGDLRCPPPPPGANQTVVSPREPARYIHSDAPTFTRDVDDLPAGHRLVNGEAWCAVGYQGSVTCVSGANGFTLAWWGGILEKA